MRIPKTILPFLLLIFLCQGLSAQKLYTAANVHAHNDYQQPVPFFTAHSKQVGSIEADVFLQNGDLYVAHELKEIQPGQTLEALYLRPLQKKIQQHNGTPYGQPEAKLQLLIDLKTGGEATLPVLVKMLGNYPEISTNPAIQVVISGNKPAPATWSQYPGFICFDGTPGESYTLEELERIPVFSDNFRKYTQWNGKGPIDSNERTRIEQLIDSVHHLHKKFRFWATPDNETSWQTLMRLEADYLGTDDVVGLTGYLQGLRARKPRRRER